MDLVCCHGNRYDVISAFNSFTPKPARLSILLCLMPDDFTRQWGTPRSQWVKLLPNNRVAKILIVCLHYEISFFGIFHRFTNTIATKNPLKPP